MNQNVSWEQLAKYFAGELPREEHQKMETWITGDPEREQEVKKLYEIWNESGFSSSSLSVDEAWSRLSQHMDEWEQASQKDALLGPQIGTKRPKRGGRKVRRSASTIRRWVMAAAAAAILLTAGLFTYYNYSATSNEVVEIGNRELIARNGERATYELNDGSRIILHAGSRLEVPPQFNGEKRELFLEGEAYFEVTPDSTKPFIVHAGEAYTRVLGTKFLVQAWPDNEGEVDVVVSEGKVALGNNQPLINDNRKSKEATITRNKKGILKGDGSPVVIEDADVDWYMGWTQGKLTFDNRSLSEIIPKLERWYAVQINIADEQIGAKKLTAEIDYSQPMGEVLQGMAMSLDLKLEQNERTFTFHPKRNEN